MNTKRRARLQRLVNLPPLSRRTLLRGALAGGAGLVLPLPRLARMLDDNGEALANGGDLPCRFGTWFFGNGIIPERWIPRGTGVGDNWELSEQLAPLLPVKSHLSVMTGFTIKLPNDEAHASMPAAALTGAGIRDRRTVRQPTVDQLLAQDLSEDTVFPTGIHVGIGDRSGGGRLGTNSSFRGPNAPNPPQFNPEALFGQLVQFSDRGNNGGNNEPDPELTHRSKVLDAVEADAASLRARLGVADQQRLEQHLEGVSQLQRQLETLRAPKTLAPLREPDELYPNRGGNGAITRQRGQAFADLLVFALASDLTGVFSYLFTCSASHGNYADCGLDNSSFHEDYGHRLSRDGLSSATRGFNTGIKYTMANFSDLLGKMKDTPDGAGNLLDNSCVYATSCVSESQTHSGTEYPLLVAGKGSGKLKGDTHIRRADDNVSRVPFTLLNALGREREEWGEQEARVTSGVEELLA